MKPQTIATVQISALLLFVILRTSVPTGWAAWIFIISVAGPLAVLTPTGLALLAARRTERLSRAHSALYLGAAVALVAAGALVADSDGRTDGTPLSTLAHSPDLYRWSRATDIGGLLAWTYAGFVVALLVLDLVALARREAAAGRLEREQG